VVARTAKAALVCLALANICCVPRADAQTYVSLAYGGISCTNWNSRKALEGKVYEAWMLGYISSYNAYVFKGPNVFDGSDAEDLRGWVDGYCREHLDDSLDTVVRVLIDERARKAAN
jgi:hypothetical protein